MQSLKDLNGNTLTVTAAGISSTNGLSVPFVRDSSGRITRITDTLGHQYNYVYDASGNLASVASPGIATPAQYTYDGTHLLTSETDRRGNPAGTTTYYPDGKLKSVTDAVGNLTQYSYDTVNRTTTITNPDGGTTVTVADSYGKPLSVTESLTSGLQRTTTHVYDTKHNETSMTDALGKTTFITYDSNGFQTSRTDPLGNTWSKTYNQVGGPITAADPVNPARNVTNATYDANFRVSSITDSLGAVAQLTYNPAGLPLTFVDPRGNTSSYVYDQYGNRTSSTDALRRTTSSVFDTLGNLTSVTDPRGNTTSYVYDAYNRRISMTDAMGKITRYTYDGNGNKATETDRNNHQTTYTYDNANRLTQVLYADGTTRSYTYDFRNNKLTETDQLGRTTKYVYDLAGRMTSMTVAFGTADAATTSYTYDGDDRKLTQTDPRGNMTIYTYDDAGRMTSMKDGAGNLTTYGYDSKGQRTSTLDAKNRTTAYTYDARGRQLTTTTPDGKTVTKTYDGLGKTLTVQDEESNTTTYGYDAASQLLTVTDALNQVTRYTYDLAGNKTSQKDARGNTTSYVWDSLNRRTLRALPLGQTEQYTYDFEGNMQTHVDFNGKTITFAYDSLNRLLSRTPDASFGASPVSFTYTATGQRQSMTDASGVTNYSYNNRDQALSKATPQGALTYTYDPTGNVTSVVSSNANGTSVSYAYDQNNRLSSVTDNRTSGTTNYVYDPTNQLSSMAYPNGVTHGYGYDTRDRMTALNLNGPGGALASYAQTFSPSGRETSDQESTGRTENYSYNTIYRLTNENITGDPTAAYNGSLAYTLDQVGNRLALSSTLAALPSQTKTYDADDRISGDTFDNNGNTLTSSGVTYGYEFEDRLVSTSTGVQITYNGDGNRVSETVGGVTTSFLVDEHNPTGYAQVTEEIVSGSVSAQYTHGLLRISQRRSGTVSYYGYDGGASVRQLFDNAGTVTDTYAYDAFGNTVARTGATVNPYQYRGEQFDAALQMYYLRARYYIPRTGRFLTQDKYEPIDLVLCSCSGQRRIVVTTAVASLFQYGAADPIDFVDPLGQANLIFQALKAAFLERGTQIVIAAGGIYCWAGNHGYLGPLPRPELFAVLCDVEYVLLFAAFGIATAG